MLGSALGLNDKKGTGQGLKEIAVLVGETDKLLLLRSCHMQVLVLRSL